MPFLTKLCKVSVFIDQALSGKCGMAESFICQYEEVSISEMVFCL